MLDHKQTDLKFAHSPKQQNVFIRKALSPKCTSNCPQEIEHDYFKQIPTLSLESKVNEKGFPANKVAKLNDKKKQVHNIDKNGAERQEQTAKYMTCNKMGPLEWLNWEQYSKKDRPDGNCTLLTHKTIKLKSKWSLQHGDYFSNNAETKKSDNNKGNIYTCNSASQALLDAKNSGNLKTTSHSLGDHIQKQKVKLTIRNPLAKRNKPQQQQKPEKHFQYLRKQPEKQAVQPLVTLESIVCLKDSSISLTDQEDIEDILGTLD